MKRLFGYTIKKRNCLSIFICYSNFLSKIFGSIAKILSLQQIIKLRHSFLNGHGRPRTASGPNTYKEKATAAFVSLSNRNSKDMNKASWLPAHVYGNGYVSIGSINKKVDEKLGNQANFYYLCSARESKGDADTDVTDVF